MLSIFNKLFVLLFFPCLIFSCTSAQKGNEQQKALTDSTVEYTEAELEAQDAAFSALNTIQISTDERNRLYSTFPNINQPCYPADTSIEISQAELLIFMEQFITKHCENLTPEIQSKLAKRAVLAQEKYTVLHCTEGNKSNINYEKGLPMIGTWVMPNVVGERDIILVW